MRASPSQNRRSLLAELQTSAGYCRRPLTCALGPMHCRTTKPAREPHNSNLSLTRSAQRGFEGVLSGEGDRALRGRWRCAGPTGHSRPSVAVLRLLPDVEQDVRLLRHHHALADLHTESGVLPHAAQTSVSNL